MKNVERYTTFTLTYAVKVILSVFFVLGSVLHFVTFGEHFMKGN